MGERLLAIGLDLGTSGARAVALDLSGQWVASGRGDLPREACSVNGPRVEQDPEAWTTAAQSALRQLTQGLPPACKIVGIAVDATSGTFLLADGRGRPLTRGLMYNDLRAVDVWQDVAEAMRPDLDAYGIRMAAAFALSKLVHLARHEPQLLTRCRRVVHQTDWVVGMLSGRYDVTDVSTALKTGADPGKLVWPQAIERLGIARDILPRIVLPGTPIGEVTPAAASATGLPAGIPVVAGCTDGTAGCLASGASQTGDLNVTLGTTLVYKAIADRVLADPQGEIYNHRHPAGGFLPGAASSTGAEWIEKHFPRADLDALSQAAWRLLPTRAIAYPLVKAGERFPFSCAKAAGFGLERIADPLRRLAAGMEGVAFLERMGVERFERLGLPIRATVYATGGGAASTTWLRIRAAVNRRVYSVPLHPECAVGAAVLAAMPHLGGCRQALASLVRSGEQVEPDDELARAYGAEYERFRAALRERGYL